VGEVGGRVGGAVLASFLLAIGVVLWLVNQRFGGGRREMDTGVLQAVEHPDDR
jgi:hypothetical protein